MQNKFYPYTAHKEGDYMFKEKPVEDWKHLRCYLYGFSVIIGQTINEENGITKGFFM